MHGHDACECVSGPRPTPTTRPLLAIAPLLQAANSILFGSSAGEHLACEDAATHLGLSTDLVKEALRAAVDSSGLRAAVEGERQATEAARAEAIRANESACLALEGVDLEIADLRRQLAGARAELASVTSGARELAEEAGEACGGLSAAMRRVLA